MNDLRSFFRPEKIIDLVLMNEEVCLHEAEFSPDMKRLAFAAPACLYHPRANGREMKVYISCPVCGHHYEEAASRIKKEILKYPGSPQEG